jgi:hypothetical protein
MSIKSEIELIIQLRKIIVESTIKTNRYEIIVLFFNISIKDDLISEFGRKPI